MSCSRGIGMRKRLPYIAALLVSSVALLAGLSPRPAQGKPPLNLAVVRQQFRNEYIKFETVIDSLAIKPGMTILDIGSGPGYASFVFAEKLQGTGSIYATDIREDFVKYIAEEAKRKGLTNLFPVVVKEKGLDEFYGTHRYDLVFLSNVYHCLDGRIEYFRTLRGYLKPGARLVLILYNEVPLFSADDLADVEGLIQSLSRETDDPFVRRLSPGTKQLLKGRRKEGSLESALVDDFNWMLTDPQFYKDFYGDSYFKKDYFTPDERDFANWLLMTLSEEGTLERPADQIDAKTMRTVIKLNRLFFISRFGKYLRNEGRGSYLPAGDANRHMSKYVMLRELGTAGYAFSREISVSPYFTAVIMTPKAP